MNQAAILLRASTTFGEPVAAVQQFESRNVCKTLQRGHVPNLSMVPSNQYDIGINLRRMEQFSLTNLFWRQWGNQIGAEECEGPERHRWTHVDEFAANEC